jgi:uridine kinase
MAVMPAGLDGNPDPIVTAPRDVVLGRVVERIVGCGPGRVLVGVDGRSGAGKSTFADELADRLVGHDRTVIRSTTDSFHRPRAERMRRGPTSAEGYFLDSFQLPTIIDDLLRPFAGGGARVRIAAFDEPSDRPLDVYADRLPPDAVLVFDGLFLHRAELAGFWDLTVYLDADTRREAEWLAYLEDGLPVDPVTRARELDRRLRRARWPRYRDGWQRYLDAADPARAATITVDNNDLSEPAFVVGGPAHLHRAPDPP